MKEITIFLDDSGVLSKNAPEEHFVYAGYMFLSEEDKNYAKRRYIAKIKQLRKKTGREDELKAAKISLNGKRKLYSVMKPFYSLSAYVNTNRVYDYILEDKLAIHRYKDYVVKMLIKKQTKRLIADGLIDPNEDIKISIFLDEQATATNGYYTLKASVYEELKVGISNWEYGTTHPPLIFGDFHVEVSYFDSKHNYLGQASDILANRIWTSYVQNNLELRNRQKHFHLTFP
ncbi:DUF3800 domain-containing protein [Weissella confusa]|uniref:DUF3800 domain-containing protein n=1 Tax=Weissella TaxID=46255 RepID=UPI00107EEB0C|nr:DUF3800 domain-containing protein [Weissella confusa]TGE65395.1 hypothetical protein C6P17_06390 [Weissella confusa]